jgi:hypothetical protein
MTDWPVFRVIAGSVDRFGPWVDGNSLRVYTDSVYAAVDVLSTGLSAPAPIPTTTYSYPLVISPDGNFGVELGADTTLLTTVPDGQIIASFDWPMQACESIRWRPDSTGFSAAMADGRAVLVDTFGKITHEFGAVLPCAPVGWSPDGQSVLLIREIPGELGYATYDIGYLDGRPDRVTGARISSPNNWLYAYWLTESVIVNWRGGAGYQKFWYHVAETGLLLFEDDYNATVYGEPVSNQPEMSPDFRWVVFDVCQYEPLTCNRIGLLNLETLEVQLGPALNGKNLAFQFWGDDGRFYLIAQPQSAADVEDPDTSGLYALDPLTFALVELVPEIYFAAFNPQHTFGFALFPAPRGGMGGALIDPLGGPVGEIHQMSARMLYRDSERQLPIPMAWSNAGDRLVYVDDFWVLWLADSSGERLMLAKEVWFDRDQPVTFQIFWSPDDSHLLIVSYSGAWVLAVP